MIFSLNNNPFGFFWGTPIYGNPHMLIMKGSLFRAILFQRNAGKELVSRTTHSVVSQFRKKNLHLVFFPTCQVRVARFYVSWLPPSAAFRLLRTSTTTIHAKCSLPDLNRENPRQVFPAGPQPRESTPSVPCRTSTATIHAQCSLPDLNRENPSQVFPAGPQPPERTPKDMPDRMPDRTSDRVPDRMPEKSAR